MPLNACLDISYNITVRHENRDFNVGRCCFLVILVPAF